MKTTSLSTLESQTPLQWISTINWILTVALLSTGITLPNFATAGTLVVVDKPVISPPVSRLAAGQEQIHNMMSNLNTRLAASEVPAHLCSHPRLQALPEILQTRTQRHLHALENEYKELLQLSEDLTQARQALAISEGLRKGSTSLLGGTLLGRAWASFKMASLLGSFLGLTGENQLEHWVKSEFLISAETAYRQNSAELTKEIPVDFSTPDNARITLRKGFQELNTRLEAINAKRTEAFKNLPPQNRWYSLGADAEKSLVTALDASVAQVGFLLFEIQSEIHWRHALHELCEKTSSNN